MYNLILGRDLSSGNYITQVNCLLLYANYYIYRQRLYGQSRCDITEWLFEVRGRLQRERYICGLEHKEKKFAKWLEFYESL